MSIKVKVHVDEYTNTCYYKDFDIVDELPEVGETFDFYAGSYNEIVEVNKIDPDCENNDEVWNYDYYELVYDYVEEDEDGSIAERDEKIDSKYVAVLKEYDFYEIDELPEFDEKFEMCEGRYYNLRSISRIFPECGSNGYDYYELVYDYITKTNDDGSVASRIENAKVERVAIPKDE